MRYFLSFILFLFSTLSIFSDNRDVLAKANALIANKKYLSAYKLLDKTDPYNSFPNTTIAKIDLLMKYHTVTEKFYKFGLKDFASSNSIETNSDKDKRTNITFYPDSVLNTLIKRYPTNYSLHQMLGKFYYEIHLRYGQNKWFIPDSVIFKRMKENYIIAYENNKYDDWSLFGLGYVHLLENNNKKAISFLRTSEILNPDNPLTYYNLASAYFNLNRYEEALNYAQQAYDKQNIPYYKSEASRLLGMIYYKLKKQSEAYQHLKEANNFAPNDYKTLIYILNLELQLNKTEYEETVQNIFLLSPSNPMVYKDMLEAYKNANKLTEYTTFLEQQKVYYRTNKDVLANICFYTGISLYETKNWTQAKINFEKARSLFSTLYDRNHTVFEVINSYTDALKKK